jgi:hypothetical protein
MIGIERERKRERERERERGEKDKWYTDSNWKFQIPKLEWICNARHTEREREREREKERERKRQQEKDKEKEKEKKREKKKEKEKERAREEKKINGGLDWKFKIPKLEWVCNARQKEREREREREIERERGREREEKKGLNECQLPGRGPSQPGRGIKYDPISQRNRALRQGWLQGYISILSRKKIPQARRSG